MRRLCLLACLLLTAWLTTLACPAPEGPKACNTNSDCSDGQRCIAKFCKDPADAGTPDNAPTETTEVTPEPEPVSEQTPESQPEPRPEPQPEPEPEFDPNAPCTPGATRLCYDGPAGTRGVGACIQGRSTCLQSKKWDTCLGQATPKDEVCNGKDDNCDGTTDEGAKCDACSECKGGKCVVRDDVAPKLTKITPNPVVYITSLTIEVEGECFADKAEIIFDGTPVKTTFVSRTKLEATLDLTNVLPGKYPITVKNPSGKVSSAVDLEINRPTCSGTRPFISKLTPEYGEATKKITLEVAGSSFMMGSQIIFDGKAIPTKFVNASTLQADPTLDLTNVTAGDYKIGVNNPNGCDATAVNFFVIDPGAKPQITTITPSTVKLEQSNRLVIEGKNFLPGINFFVGLNSITGLRFVSSTRLEVTFTPKASDGWTTGTKQAHVLNSNQAQSNTFTLTFQ